MPPDETNCRWTTGAEAFRHFAVYSGLTQSQQHIRPLHWYVACRLVVEGGFLPDEITPRPPFTIRRRGREVELTHDPAVAGGGEATILGGLKTKNVDVVVSKKGIGPVLAVSCKGMTGAVRNLTNRMEETVGECTNLHITYPALVLGYLFLIRANRTTEVAVSGIASESAPPSRQLAANDIAIQKGGEPVEGIIRFHSALRELTGRHGIRNDVSRYEAIALALIEIYGSQVGTALPAFPPKDSPVHVDQFFKTLYLRYDERFVFSAPDLKATTRRREWAPSSPALDASHPDMPGLQDVGYEARIAVAPDNTRS